jgi:glycosyltransferase involved in cell wall biosynthesis
MLTVGLYWIFILAIVGQWWYAFYFFRRIYSLRGYKEKEQEAAYSQVSIIICAKNEGTNLRKNLPAILSQKYSGGYEVIVVNDASTDDTAKVLQELELQYDNLWDVVIGIDAERNMQGKKFALSKGVAVAANNWLLLTDADCMPASDKWLELMITPLANGKEIVAGYGGYNKTLGILNAFIRWETMHTFLQYSTYALAGKPYMGVGRNIACTKEVLQKAQQNEVWNALPSGDDDLLVSIAGNADDTAVVCDERAFTYTDAKRTWSEWVRQKQRHLSTGKYYKGDVKLLLGGYGVLHTAMWAAFFVLLFTDYREIALILIAVRSLWYWTLWAVTAHKLHERRLVYLFPFFDIAWMVYNFAFFPYITWKTKKHWR